VRRVVGIALISVGNYPVSCVENVDEMWVTL